MDAALLAEREAFKRKAMAVPTVENKKRKKEKDDSSSKKPSSGSFKAPKSSLSSKFGVGGSQYKFGVLGKKLRFEETYMVEGFNLLLVIKEIFF